MAKNLSAVSLRKNKEKQNWPTVELGEITEIGAGNSAPQNKKLFKDGTYPFCRTADVGKVHVSDNFKEIKDLLNEEGTRGLKLHKKNTILFPKSGASTFLNHRVMLAVDSYVSSHLATIYADGREILPQFLFSVLRLVDARSLISDQSYPSIRLSKISEIKIPLPPLSEQKRIVAKINKQMAIVEKMCKAAEEQTESIETLSAALLRKTQEKQNWPMVELREIVEVSRGGSPRPIAKFITEAKNGINWIKIGDAKEGEKYITKTKEKIRPEGASKTKLVKEGDFILSNSMSFGRPYILKTSGAIHDGWLLLRLKNKSISPDFLYYTLGSPDTKFQFEKSATGGIVKNLNSELVKKTEIPLPPLPVQKRIVSTLEKQTALQNRISQMAETQLEAINALPSSFLRRELGENM